MRNSVSRCAFGACGQALPAMTLEFFGSVNSTIVTSLSAADGLRSPLHAGAADRCDKRLLHCPLFDNQQRRIEVHPVDRTGEGIRLVFHVFAPVPGIEFVYEPLEKLDIGARFANTTAVFFRPIRGAQVLTSIETVFAYVPEQGSERDQLMIELMTAVIDQDIDRTDFPDHVFEKCGVALASNKHPDTRCLKALACRIDVEPDDARFGTEIPAPDFQ